MTPKKFYTLIVLTHIALTAVVSVLMYLFATDAWGLYTLLSLLWVAAVIAGQLDMTEYERRNKMERMKHDIKNFDQLLVPSIVTGLLFVAHHHTQCHVLLILAAIAAAVLTAMVSSVVMAVFSHHDHRAASG